MRRLLPLSLLTLLALPLAASAYDTSSLDYDDAPWDLKTSLAVSTLTDAGLVHGYPDGAFRPARTVNRAEFLHVAMNTRMWTQVMPQTMNCFPDVRGTEWFALDACRAKEAGIVEGVTHADGRKWFEPARGVTYAEALKILMVLNGTDLDHVNASAWYDTYVRTADRLDLGLAGSDPTDLLTRGGMARLVAGFMAYENGDLDEYRDAESGMTHSSSRSSVRSSSRSSVSSVRSSSVSSRSSMSSMSASSLSSGSSQSRSSMSSMSDQTQAVRSTFLLLGQDSATVAGFDVFSNLEPVQLRRVIVTLASPATSVNSFLVYDEDGTLLGRATRGSGGAEYTLNVPTGTSVIGRRDEHAFYLRARLNAFESGGESGEEVRVSSIRVEGDGEWSNESFGQTSNETYPTFVTARGKIESIVNAGPNESVLTAGAQRLLAEFRVRGSRTDSQADVRLTSLVFQIESSGDVTLSDVDIRVAGSDAAVDCTVGGSQVSCVLPPSVGEVDDGEKVLRVYGDVTLAPGADDPYVRLTLNEPGSPSSAGSVTWTDGDTTFQWVSADAPIVRGTLYR